MSERRYATKVLVLDHDGFGYESEVLVELEDGSVVDISRLVRGYCLRHTVGDLAHLELTIIAPRTSIDITYGSAKEPDLAAE